MINVFIQPPVPVGVSSSKKHFMSLDDEISSVYNKSRRLAVCCVCVSELILQHEALCY